MNIQKRDIVVAIILSFVTCGIYGIYCFVNPLCYSFKTNT